MRVVVTEYSKTSKTVEADYRLKDGKVVSSIDSVFSGNMKREGIRVSGGNFSFVQRHFAEHKLELERTKVYYPTDGLAFMLLILLTFRGTYLRAAEVKD